MYFGHTGKGNHDRTEQCILKEGGESEQALSPSNEGMKPTNFIWLI
jgi:hypothetical protein